MNARAKQLLDEVLELPREEREAFAAKILESLDEDDARHHEELDRRLASAESATFTTWDEAKARIRGTR